MVNQWGRDGTASSGSRASGGAGIVIAAIVALVLGGGGGYAGARLLAGGASSGEIESRDARIATLEKQVSDLKFQGAGTETQENVLRQRVEELTKANETLKALADDNAGTASADARAEIAALKKTIEEAGDVRSELSRARRSLQVSELQIIDLESQIKGQNDELKTLRASLADTAGKDDAATKALTARIGTLETRLAAAQKQAADATDLRTKLASTQADLTKASGELALARGNVRALQKEIEKGRADLATLRRQLADAQASDEADSLRKRIANAEKLLAARDRELRDMTTSAREAQIRMDAANANSASAQAEAARLGTSLRKAEGDNDKLAREVAALKQTIESLQTAPVEPDPQPDTPDDTPTGRDAAAVRAALADMPGYGRLTPERQTELARRLTDGECAADALKAALGRVPAIALRNLIRDLGSKC